MDRLLISCILATCVALASGGGGYGYKGGYGYHGGYNNAPAPAPAPVPAPAPAPTPAPTTTCISSGGMCTATCTLGTFTVPSTLSCSVGTCCMST